MRQIIGMEKREWGPDLTKIHYILYEILKQWGKSPEFDESTINTKEDGEPELKEWETTCVGEPLSWIEGVKVAKRV